ncbi:MAG: RdgB/HAM1 family non-canonical purine NTP pyrophosphatase [Rickettsiales bacterium]
MNEAAPHTSPTWLKGSPLVIASHNQGKVAEIRKLIAPFGIEVLSANDAKLDEPEETGKTFAENAELKARAAATSSGMVSLADDSGLAVSALGGAPGIYSARWAGPDKDFNVAFERIQKELAEKADATMAAYFICMLCLCFPDGQTHFFEGRIDGTLTFPPRGDKGFGYDPIFIADGYDITFAQMDPAEKNNISHRARAFEKFVSFIKNQS